MKNLSLILSTVLLVAVGVLYYLHFSGGSQKATMADLPAGSIAIAYINSDSIMKNYEFVKDQNVVMESKSKKMNSDYTNRAQSLQSEIAAYQRNQANYTIGQARALEEDLGKKQQNLQMYEQSLSQQMMNEQAKVSKELYDRLTGYLKKYSTEKGIQVVMKYDPTSDVLYGGESLDITSVVLSGLNEEYNAEKSGGKNAADSTSGKK
jgi:outer membrane protein